MEEFWRIMKLGLKRGHAKKFYLCPFCCALYMVSCLCAIDVSKLVLRNVYSAVNLRF
jgi:hypothetical protein